MDLYRCLTTGSKSIGIIFKKLTFGCTKNSLEVEVMTTTIENNTQAKLLSEVTTKIYSLHKVILKKNFAVHSHIFVMK